MPADIAKPPSNDEQEQPTRSRQRKSIRRRIKDFFSTDEYYGFDSNLVAKFIIVVMLGATAVGTGLYKWPEISARFWPNTTPDEEPIITGGSQEPVHGIAVEADRSPPILPTPAAMQIAARYATEAEMRNSKEFQQPRKLSINDPRDKRSEISEAMKDGYSLWTWDGADRTKPPVLNVINLRFRFKQAKRVTLKFSDLDSDKPGVIHFDEVPRPHQRMGNAELGYSPFYWHRGGGDVRNKDTFQQRTYEIIPPRENASAQEIARRARDAGENILPLRISLTKAGRARISLTVETWDDQISGKYHNLIVNDNRDDFPKKFHADMAKILKEANAVGI